MSQSKYTFAFRDCAGNANKTPKGSPSDGEVSAVQKHLLIRSSLTSSPLVLQQSEMVGHADRRTNLCPHHPLLPLACGPEIGQLLQVDCSRHSTGPYGQAQAEGL